MAPLGFFTGRKDIPRYMLNGDGNCRFAQVVVGEPSANRLDHELELQINDNLIGELEFYDNQDDPMESSISNEGSHLPQNEPGGNY